MRDRVERVGLWSGVTLDVETVDTRIGELREGTCQVTECYGNTSDKYREHLTRWADAMGWKIVKDNSISIMTPKPDVREKKHQGCCLLM